MVESGKYLSVGGAGGGISISDLKSLSSFYRTRRTIAFAYGFMFAFLAFTLFLLFTSSSDSASPLFSNIFSTPVSATTTRSSAEIPFNSRFDSIFYYFFPNSSSLKTPKFSRANPQSWPEVQIRVTSPPLHPPLTSSEPRSESPSPNTTSKSPAPLDSDLGNELKKAESVSSSNNSDDGVIQRVNVSSGSPPKTVAASNSTSAISGLTASLKKQNDEEKKLVESLMKCDFYDGNWVRDNSYPLYKPGSCSLIDEQFNCFLNGRPDQDFQKLKWKPKGCILPRLDGSRMLDLLRGKRLVFVGDSLNRNMWESLVCILRNSVKDQTKVFEESGRQYFRTDASYSFIFQDYNFTVEMFVTPFLVQEWEALDKNGTKKDTLRLDMVERSSGNYKDADFIIFNTGHWWTHEKTATGKDYYQEGSHVYEELNVIEAFRRALTTWGRWIDANINFAKTMVFFRGYSASHFSGGQWNSGGQCDSETEPIRNDTYLAEYPEKMSMLERVMKGMKKRVVYMNITRMSDYRKDGHPSVYRKLNLSDEERRSPLMFQDCSHWCLPGVPDAWNEFLYAQILMKHHNRLL